jgi:serine/threonine protein kinase
MKQAEVPRPGATSAVGPVGVPGSARVPVDASRKTPVAVGDIINGKYLIEAFIGEGGVGLVAAAQNIELDERVALKFLRPEMLVQTDIVARFMREAKAACSIKSEYVASVYDVGTMADGAPFLVMEYLEGKDLGSVILQRGTIGYREATEYVMQTCEALAVAHAKGVVHRDIKPENLFLTSRAGMSVIKVLDFGISKAALTGSIFGSALPLVKTVNLMGTPLYMSPEQVRCADTVDSRSDIWSLGMVLYELLTGTLPVSATSITELCAAILESPLASISNYRTDLPPGYVAVLERCLEKDPNRRFQNVAELAMAFMPFAPKRARICAERAAQALRSAGLVEESSVRFTSTVPPPHGYSSANPITQPSIPRMEVSGSYPMVAHESTSSVPTNVSGSMPAIPGTPLLPGPSLTAPQQFSGSAPASAPALVVQASDPPPRASRAKLVVAFAAVALVAAGAAATATRLGDGAGRSAAPAVVATHDTKPSSAETAATPVPATPAPATTEAAPREQVTVGTATAPRPVAPTIAAKKGGPAFVWPPPKAGAAKAGPAAGAAPATNAKKSSDEPDLGY